MILKIAAYLLLATFFLLERFLRKGETAKNISAKKIDKKSTLLLLIAYFTVLAVSLVLNATEVGTFANTAIAIAGLIFMAIGIVIRIWSMSILKAYFTRTLDLADKQSLITRGPYAIVRHPGYLGSLLIWGFAGLAMQNFVIFFISVTMLVVAYAYRINSEEEMMHKNFGNLYEEYKKHTWKVLPPIW
jgi:protein-S-isoprenylcysteine O-methyltransferase Ste14